MSPELTLYTQRAEECAAEARTAVLDNVRVRALRSEAAWRVMADRRQRIDRRRAEAAEDKARLADTL